MRVCLTRCRTSMCQVFEKKHYGFSNLPYADIPKTRKFKRVPKTPESKQGCRQKLKRLPALEGSSGANQQEKKDWRSSPRAEYLKPPQSALGGRERSSRYLPRRVHRPRILLCRPYRPEAVGTPAGYRRSGDTIAEVRRSRLPLSGRNGTQVREARL